MIGWVGTIIKWRIRERERERERGCVYLRRVLELWVGVCVDVVV